MTRSGLLIAALAASTIAGAASAADLPSRKTAAVAPAPVFTWSGAYVGLQAGGLWDTFGAANNWWGVLPGYYWSGSTNRTGFVGGAHIGLNLQSDMFVFGVEGDLEGTSVAGSGLRGSARGRLGVAFDRTLLYVTGGLAGAGGNNNATWFGRNYGRNGMGWTAGAGVEYAFAPAWSARLEYRYSQFGSSVNNGVVGWNDNGGARRENSVRLGVSYHFGGLGGAPVVAKY
ncbi:MAG: porin family protein [Hyphomicrobiales bacterium]|nr:porin family protein [Hyphomicrobiales bacterium]